MKVNINSLIFENKSTSGEKLKSQPSMDQKNHCNGSVNLTADMSQTIAYSGTENELYCFTDIPKNSSSSSSDMVTMTPICSGYNSQNVNFDYNRKNSQSQIRATYQINEYNRRNEESLDYGVKDPQLQQPSQAIPYQCKKSRKKTTRSPYTRMQIQELEKEFRNSYYIGKFERREMSETLNLSERQIKTWFQNRRTKDKKEQKTKKITASFARPFTPDSQQNSLSDLMTRSNDNMRMPQAYSDYAPVIQQENPNRTRPSPYSVRGYNNWDQDCYPVYPHTENPPYNTDINFQHSCIQNDENITAQSSIWKDNIDFIEEKDSDASSLRILKEIENEALDRMMAL